MKIGLYISSLTLFLLIFKPQESPKRPHIRHKGTPPSPYKVNDWDSGGTLGYRWVNADHVIASVPTKNNFSFFTSDISAKNITLLPQLDEGFNKTGDETSPILLSPDMQKILWTMTPSEDTGRNPAGVFWCNLTGAGMWGWLDYVDQAAWMPEGNRWFATTGPENSEKATRAVIYNVSKKKEERRITLPANWEEGDILTITKNNDLLIHNRGLDETDRQGRAHVYLHLYKIGLKVQLDHKRDVVLPLGAEMQNRPEIEVSPDGAHLAWLFNFRKGERVPMRDIWISNLDGSKLHQLRRFQTNNSPNVLDEEPYMLRWKLDNRSVSVIYKNALEIVPVISGENLSH